MTYVNRDMQMCTAQKRDGSFCGSKSVPDAPFPICVTHAASLMRFLDDAMPRDRDDRMITAMRMHAQDEERANAGRARRPQPGVVYYIRVGKHVKIGYASDLPRRINKYPPDSQLLGYEYGTLSLEAQRHREFAQDLRMGREWFAPSDRLMAHISSVNVRRQQAA